MKKTNNLRDSGRLIFLDRDGTLNRDTNFVYKINDLEILPGVVEGLKLLQRYGYRFVVITNQSGIGRSIYTEEEMHKFNKFLAQSLLKYGIKIEKFYFCPHLPEEKCLCRKPSPYFINQALEEFNAEREYSYIVGDRIEDGLAGKNAGIKTVLVKTGPKPPSPEEETVTFDFVCENFEEACKIIMEDIKRNEGEI